MAKKISDRMLDVRVNQRYVKRGNISQKDLDGHIKTLPDLVDACEHLDLNESEEEETAAGINVASGSNGAATVQ